MPPAPDEPSQAAIPKPAYRNAQPALPPELWARILTHLTTPHHIGLAAQVDPGWHAETTSPLFDPVWRRIWDATATLPSHRLCSPYLRVRGSWRDQVAASFRLERLHASRVVFLPPRYDSFGDVLDDDRLSIAPCRIDVEDVLGRAVAVHAFAQAVLVAFEKGVGLLRHHHPYQSRRAPANTAPLLYYDDSPQLHAIQMLAASPTSSGTLVAATATSALRIDVTLQRPYRPFTFKTLDTFHNAGTPVQLCISTDESHAGVGFFTGAVRLISLSGGCRHAFTLPESADHLAINGRWALAASSFQPIALSVWDLADGSLHAAFTQTSPAWKDVFTVAALTPTSVEDHFALWKGRDAVRIFDAKTGEFVRVVNVPCRFSREPRSATEEGEHGAACPHLGRGKMALSMDRLTAAIATSNRVMIVSLDPRHGSAAPVRQLDHARRALVAMSTDDRVIVTAESDAFGSLRLKVSGRTGIASRPRLQVWNAESETLRCELELPSPATALSVCGHTVAVVCGAVGQAMIAFGGPS